METLQFIACGCQGHSQETSRVLRAQRPGEARPGAAAAVNPPSWTGPQASRGPEGPWHCLVSSEMELAGEFTPPDLSVSSTTVCQENASLRFILQAPPWRSRAGWGGGNSQCTPPGVGQPAGIPAQRLSFTSRGHLRMCRISCVL